MTTPPRVPGQKLDIDTGSTRAFFEERARRFRPDRPLTSILYQDANPAIAEARDRHERELVLPQLRLQPDSRVLDLGCGIGRWADATLDRVAAYCGVDFSEGLIELARSRCVDPKARFVVDSAENAAALLLPGEPLFDRIIISGVLIYLNDAQVQRLVAGLQAVSAPSALLYVREPVGLDARLTLNGFWSSELEAEYSAIYRSQAELDELVFTPLREAGFRLVRNEPVYSDEELNNRRETRQYYFILERGPQAGAA